MRKSIFEVGDLVHSARRDQDCVITDEVHLAMGVPIYGTTIGPQREDELTKVMYNRRRL
jgi:hypothetical protein